MISLPESSLRRYHRVAVALGGKGKVLLQWGDFGNGFVHICDDYSVGPFFSALDTISDFVDFLDASEAIVRSGTRLLFDGGGIEDLLALYILNGRSFDLSSSDGAHPDMMVLHDDLWNGLVESKDFRKMNKDLAISYCWDRLVDILAHDLLSGGMFDMHSKKITDNELALVTMALEPRMNRLVLAEAMLEFWQKPEIKSSARVVQGRRGCGYVFTVGPSEDREMRARELGLRCLVTRGRLPHTTTVVGIASDRPGTGTIGYSCDIVYLHMPTWTSEDEQRIRGIQKDLGYFNNTRWS